MLNWRTKIGGWPLILHIGRCFMDTVQLRKLGAVGVIVLIILLLGLIGFSRGWITLSDSIVGPLIVGLVFWLCTLLLNPLIAREVKREESILTQRYMACEDAVSLLYEQLAMFPLLKNGIVVSAPSKATQPDPTKVNLVYARLMLYCETKALADKFFQIVGCSTSLTIKDIADFILLLRKEIGIRKEDWTREDYRYTYPKIGNVKTQQNDGV